MFTSRRIAFLLAAVAAACSALPAEMLPAPAEFPRPVTSINNSDFEDSWFAFPLVSHFFGPLFKWFPSVTNLGPSVYSDNDTFRVSIRTQDYSKEDLKVKMKNNFIIIQGTHESKPSEHNAFQSQFFHTYSMPANASADNVTAKLSSDKWLTVTVPISGDSTKVNEGERNVEITETGEKYSPPKGEGKPTAASGAASNDDRREPTTPSGAGEREEVTEKDNSIPHGINNVVPI